MRIVGTLFVSIVCLTSAVTHTGEPGQASFYVKEGVTSFLGFCFQLTQKVLQNVDTIDAVDID